MERTIRSNPIVPLAKGGIPGGSPTINSWTVFGLYFDADAALNVTWIKINKIQ